MEFPKSLQPRFIYPIDPPTRPVINQKFQDGGESNLILSSIAIDGTLGAEWIVTTVQAKDFRAFWGTVETVDTFTLPYQFFPDACDPLLIEELLGYSPTGLWRFAEKYKLEYLSTTYWKITATFRSAIS